MSFHDDYESWQRMTASEHCPVCQQLPMPDSMVDIAELPNSWLDAEPTECLKGACHLIAKRHVVELYDLADSELLGLMNDVQRCARALKNVTGAVKINYEIHGNTIPHLHIHLYPRYVDDPFPGQPIDYRHKRPDVYKAGEFQSFIEGMRRELATAIERR
jgi:diadenosine tetraphosphate (Ap4A) HIT family hydrolase